VVDSITTTATTTIAAMAMGTQEVTKGATTMEIVVATGGTTTITSRGGQ